MEQVKNYNKWLVEKQSEKIYEGSGDISVNKTASFWGELSAEKAKRIAEELMNLMEHDKNIKDLDFGVGPIDVYSGDVLTDHRSQFKLEGEELYKLSEFLYPLIEKVATKYKVRIDYKIAKLFGKGKKATITVRM